MSTSKALIIFIVILLAGCTVTGPADDGYENSNEWVDNGRLLPEEAKTIYSSETRTGRSDESNTVSDSIKSMDYNAYQKWQQAKQNNTAEYQKFKQWQEFENYDRWKKQQSQ